MPKRESATASAQRSAAQYGQYSAPTYVTSGFPPAARRIAPLPPTLLGGTTDPGLPTESSVVGDTDRDATMLCGSAEVPVLAGADVALPAARCDAVADDGPAAALITTMVAMAATTRATGTRALRRRCRDRKVAAFGDPVLAGRFVDGFLVVGRA